MTPSEQLRLLLPWAPLPLSRMPCSCELALILLPKKWNPKTHKQAYSWRYDPRELGAAQGSTPDARRKNARRTCEADDTEP